jgi:predicted ATPase
MIQRIRLINFKGFKDFTVNFQPNTSVLIGPNNAGKSTIISALRLSSALLALGQRRKPDFHTHDERRNRNIFAYGISAAASTGFTDENVHHEFEDTEARIELHFKNKAALYAVWPVEERPYFYLEQIPGAQPPNLRVAKQFYSTIGVVQTMSPIEHQESLLSEGYVRDNLGTRLASRHFRNQLYYLKLNESDKYSQLCEYLIAHTPELEQLSLATSDSSGNTELDLFFMESSTRTVKELHWAGDGLQIWVQLLYHIWRLADSSTLILDEPDVFLHPDLQRRLIHILEDMSCQVVLATHAPEILAEASKDSVVIVDRTTNRAKRIQDDKALSDLNNILGSGFNLRLAKALRSRVALFVEGQDMRILSNLAKTIGATFVAQERGLTVVPMGGASRRGLAQSFGWLNSTVLGSAVAIYVVLDRDYLDDDDVQDLLAEFNPQEVTAHVWKRKELESYLVSESAIARAATVSEADIEKFLDKAAEDLKERVFSQMVSIRVEAARKMGTHTSTIYATQREIFETRWSDRSWRLFSCPAKDLLSILNTQIQAKGGKAVSTRALSGKLRTHEIPAEIRDLLLQVNALLA